MKRILCLVVVALMALGSQPMAADGATTSPYSPKNSTVFNNPKGTSAQQRAIITQLDRAIDAAPRGSTIRMAQYLFNIDSTADKLIRAHQRGVNVHILIDDGERRSEITRVRRAIGTDRRKRSYVTTCSHSCMSNEASTMHAKFYLFSQAGSSRWVTMISSANPYTGNTYNSWNNLHTIVGDTTLYNSLNRYFNDMLPDRTNHNYYRTTSSGKYKIYLFPRAPQPGVNTIALLDVLNHTACTGVAPGYGINGRTRIRVAMWGWTTSRVDIAQRLQVLHSRGCHVEVILNKGRTNRSVLVALLKPSSRYGQMKVYDAWYDGNQNGIASLYMHHKLLTISGKWFGDPATKIVYTGSQNFSAQGTLVNNDMILRIRDSRVHYQYMVNLNYIRDRYTRRMRTVPLITKINTATVAPDAVSPLRVAPESDGFLPEGSELTEEGVDRD